MHTIAEPLLEAILSQSNYDPAIINTLFDIWEQGDSFKNIVFVVSDYPDKELAYETIRKRASKIDWNTKMYGYILTKLGVMSRSLVTVVKSKNVRPPIFSVSSAEFIGERVPAHVWRNISYLGGTCSNFITIYEEFMDWRLLSAKPEYLTTFMIWQHFHELDTRLILLHGTAEQTEVVQKEFAKEYEKLANKNALP